MLFSAGVLNNLKLMFFDWSSTALGQGFLRLSERSKHAKVLPVINGYNWLVVFAYSAFPAAAESSPMWSSWDSWATEGAGSETAEAFASLGFQRQRPVQSTATTLQKATGGP